ncbi:MAG: ribonuclease P [Methanobacteriaceae archaeon]|jgi:ribonuclease P/MRP protein subunit POP5|nr:MAG: ribonuclease P [Methanobacterium sp. BRmetb2]MCC7558709.1 ribonuclease P [Methanobacteriaceae archaeon]
MKLKILPSSLRDKKRYIAFEAISESYLNRDDIISVIWENSLNLYGECGTSNFDLWVMKVWNKKEKHLKNYYIKGVIQCKREEVDRVRAVIAIVTKYRGKRVVFHTLGISGTVKSATEKFIKLKT